MAPLDNSKYVRPSAGSVQQSTIPRPTVPTREDPLWSIQRTGLQTFEFERSQNALGLAQFDAIWRTMKDVSACVMARTLWDLGWLHRDNEILHADEIAHRTCAPDRYQALLGQWLAVLADQGLITRAVDTPRHFLGRRLAISDVQQQIEHAVAAVDTSTNYRGFIDYFLTCVREQTRLVTGIANPQKLLFPMGSWDVVEGLYRTNPASLLQNRVVAAIVREAYQAKAGSGPVRILEVGAGTGATTAAILSELPFAGIDYCFTDISRFFTKRAARQFAGEPRLRHDFLDIDRSPVEQGFRDRTFDIIVAANVLHTAKRIDIALHHLHGLLAPGGLLIAIETTSNTPLQMITFGHFDGVCHFQDQRRDSNLPFLTCRQWLWALSSAEFTRHSAVPNPEEVSSAWSQHVLIGTKGAA